MRLLTAVSQVRVLFGAPEKTLVLFEQEFFQLYSPMASYIELRSVIFASQVIFASRVKGRI